MTPPEPGEGIRNIAGLYPEGKSAFLPALSLLQEKGGGVLTRRDVRAAALILGIPPSRAWGTATFYSMLRTAPVGRYHLQVDTGVPSFLAGGDEVLSSLAKALGIAPGETTPDRLFTLSAVEDLGRADMGPAVMVNGTVYGRLDPGSSAALVASLRKGEFPSPDLTSRHFSECGALSRNFDADGMHDLEVSRSRGGYRSLEKARRGEPGAVIAAVEESGLRGRGGAAFPAGRKWRLLACNGRPVYLICNADEGEPGTFKDRCIMEKDPHLLVEGIAIAAFAVGSARAFIYIRGEYGRAASLLENAVAQARDAGLLEGLEITVHRGAGSYVCGEETALISSLEGGRGEPRPRPPYPAVQGLYGCPTVVNNVETLSSLPFLIAEGAEAFRRRPPLLFSLSGHVARPGLYELPLGTSLSSLLDMAGGVSERPDGARGTLKGVIVGGLSSPVLPAREASGLRLDYESCFAAGTAIGSGAVMVLGDTVSMPAVAVKTAEFFSGESCGLCVPCREGSYTLRRLLEGIAAGEGQPGDTERVLSLCRGIQGASLCPLGDGFASSLAAMVGRFREEFP